MKNKFRSEILKLKRKKHVNQKIMQVFLDRVKTGKLIKEENPAVHFGCFFLPISSATKSIYLGHHIKANLWIPPGGHITKNENPKDTVKREFYEELQYQLGKEKVEIFDLSTRKINNLNDTCRLHYEIWYAVYFGDRIDFRFDKNEFYNACWFSINDALRIINEKDYQPLKRLITKLL